MAFFKKKKKDTQENTAPKRDDELKDTLAKAYDELVSGKGAQSDDTQDTAQADETPLGSEVGEATAANQPEGAASGFEGELIKAKINMFKDKKTNAALTEVMKSLAGKQFMVPSVSNMESPFEKVDGEVRLKKGAVLNPALLTTKDNKTFLPIFTDEKAMTQKSPSGVILKFPFEHCIGIVYNRKNPVSAIVINPFTENFVITEELLRAVFKEVRKTDNKS